MPSDHGRTIGWGFWWKEKRRFICKIILRRSFADLEFTGIFMDDKTAQDACLLWYKPPHAGTKHYRVFLIVWFLIWPNKFDKKRKPKNDGAPGNWFKFCLGSFDSWPDNWQANYYTLRWILLFRELGYAYCSSNSSTTFNNSSSNFPMVNSNIFWGTTL